MAITLPKLSVSDAPTQNENGAGVFVFTVTLSASVNQPVLVDYTTVSGTAIAGQDFTPVSGTLTFPTGQTSKQIAVNLINDTAVEADESFTLKLSNARATLLFNDDTGSATIVSDDVAPPPPPPPPPSGWPDATNTGSSGTLTAVPGSATSGTGWSYNTGDRLLTVSGTGVTVSNLDVTGQIMITGANVTLTNCKATGNSSDFFGINVAASGNAALIDHCTVIGLQTSGGVGYSGVTVDDPSGVTIRYCNIAGGENGIAASGTHLYIHHNYIHDLIPYAGNEGADPHVDAIQLFNGISDFARIEENNVIAQADSSSCYTGAGENMVYNHNRWVGGFVGIRFKYSNTNTFTNNTVIALAGSAGNFDNEGNGSGTPVFTGNVDGNGNPVSLNS